QSPSQDLGLHLAEGRLPLPREDLAHRHPRPALDLAVQIDERRSQPPGQERADRGLAAPHEARQIDPHPSRPASRAATTSRRQLARPSRTPPRQTAPSPAAASAPAARTPATLAASMPPMAT